MFLGVRRGRRESRKRHRAKQVYAGCTDVCEHLQAFSGIVAALKAVMTLLVPLGTNGIFRAREDVISKDHIMKITSRNGYNYRIAYYCIKKEHCAELLFRLNFLVDFDKGISKTLMSAESHGFIAVSSSKVM